MAVTTFASGRWRVAEGAEDEFVGRWREFLGWTNQTYDELEKATLLRSQSDRRSFVSFAEWTSPEARDSWKHSPGFLERFTACRELCDDFEGGDFTPEVLI